MQVQKEASNREQEIPIQQRRPLKWPVAQSTKSLTCLYFSNSYHHLTNIGKGMMMLEDQSTGTWDTKSKTVAQVETYAKYPQTSQSGGTSNPPGHQKQRRAKWRLSLTQNSSFEAYQQPHHISNCFCSLHLPPKETNDKKFYWKVSLF